MATDDFGTIFGRLKAILQVYEPDLNLTTSETYNYQLAAEPDEPEKRETLFAGVTGQETEPAETHYGGEGGYVNYCLYAAAEYPELLDGISARLREHLQDNICFSFESLDEELFSELAIITENAYARYIDQSRAT